MNVKAKAAAAATGGSAVAVLALPALASIMNDGCTAGFLSEWLTANIGACCDAHDTGLNHSVDLVTFAVENWAFAQCVGLKNVFLAFVCYIVVSSPVGWLLYKFGPKVEKVN